MSLAVARRLVPTALLALALAAPAFAQRTVHLYEVQHRLAEDLMPVARVGLGDRGRASLDARSNTLLLVGDAGAVAETVVLLRSQDRLPRTVLLRHRMEREVDLAERGVRIAWSVGSGPVRVGNVRWPGSPARIDVAAAATAAHRESEFLGSVRVLEGSTGTLLVGTAMPVRTGGRRHPATALVDAPTGFRATPRVLGDGRVQVDLAPIHSDVDAAGRVVYDAVATTVVAAPGETVAIAGIASGEERRAVGSEAVHGEAQDARLLLLTVDVEPATGP